MKFRFSFLFARLLINSELNAADTEPNNSIGSSSTFSLNTQLIGSLATPVDDTDDYYNINPSNAWAVCAAVNYTSDVIALMQKFIIEHEIKYLKTLKVKPIANQ